LEKVFVGNLKKSLSEFRTYSSSLQLEQQDVLKKIHKNHQEALYMIDPQNSIEAEKLMEEQITKANQRFNTAQRLLLEQLDHHMK
jgi:hypothetical protein